MALIRQAIINRLQRKFGPHTDEGLCEIWRQGGKTRSGSDFTAAGPYKVATVACNITDLDTVRMMTEKEVGASVAHEATFGIELPAFTDVRTDDELRFLATAWRAGQYIVPGMQVTPTVSNGLIYRAYVAGGLTGTAEPDWPVLTGPDKNRGFWIKNAAYVSGTTVQPVGAGLLVFQSSGGMSGATEPTWPTTIDGTVTDNDITWTLVSLVQDNAVQWTLEGILKRYEVIEPAAPDTYEISRFCYCKLRVN